MHTCNAYKSFVKKKKKKVHEEQAHAHLLFANHLLISRVLFLSVCLFVLIITTVILLLFSCSLYHLNKLPLPGKLYPIMSAGPSRKTSHFHGVERSSNQFYLLKHHPSHLHPSLALQ